MTFHLKSIWHGFLEQSQIYSKGFCWTGGFVERWARESCGSVYRLPWKRLDTSGAQESFSPRASASKLGPAVFCEIPFSCQQPASIQHFAIFKCLNSLSSMSLREGFPSTSLSLQGLPTPLSMSFDSVCIIISSQGWGPCIHLALVNQILCFDFTSLQGHVQKTP